MNLIQVRVADVAEYEGNPRSISEEAVESMASLIETYGFRIPILVRDAGDVWSLADGHLRIRAARHLGLTQVPALDVSDMSDDEVRSFRIAVNRASEFAEWDYSQLMNEISSLPYEGDDLLQHLGMSDDLLQSLTAEASAPEVSEDSRVRSTSAARETQADPSRVRGADDTVRLSLEMTLAQRDQTVARLDSLKAEHGLATRSEAFLFLLQDKPKPTARTRARRGK